MPIYEYVCQACSYRFEVKQSIKDEPIKSCARCGREVNKIISSPAIMFKGSGWYVTDYSDKLKPTGENGGAEKTPDKPADKVADGKTAQPGSTPAASPTTPAAPASKEAGTPAGSASNTTPTPPATSS